jgi:CPA2 family monovalent cation:H+ antiporter-2
MLFDPGILLRHPLPLLGVIFIILVGKSAAAFAIVRLFGYSGATAATIAASLAQIGEFSFILAGFALTLNLIPKDGYDLVLAGALFSIMANPFLFSLVRRYEGRLEKSLPETTAGEESRPSTVAFDLRGHIIVVGYGRVGRSLVETLRGKNEPLVLVESNRGPVDFEENDVRRAVYGRADSPEILLAAGIRQARAVMIAIPRAFDAVHIVELVRRLNPAIKIIARAEFKAEAEQLSRGGAQVVLIAEQVLAERMAEALPPAPAPDIMASQGSSSVSQ